MLTPGCSACALGTTSNETAVHEFLSKNNNLKLTVYRNIYIIENR